MLLIKQEQFFCLLQSEKFGLSPLQKSSFLQCKISCPLYTGVHFRVSALQRLFQEDLTRKGPGPNFLSALVRCPLQSMSALDRFYCSQIMVVQQLYHTSLVQHIKDRNASIVEYFSLYSQVLQIKENQTILLYKTIRGNSKSMSNAQGEGGLTKTVTG